MLRRSWEPITGRVVASDVYRRYGGGDTPVEVRMKYVVEYSVDGGLPQRSEVKQAWRFRRQMVDVSGRKKVPLLLRRRGGKVRFDWKDPSINLKAHVRNVQAKRKSDFDEALGG